MEVINNMWPLEKMLGQGSFARMDRSLVLEKGKKVNLLNYRFVLEMLEKDWEITKELEDDR